jgi:phosphopentomutase
MDNAVMQMESFDAVLSGVMEEMSDELLVLITSDHGNMEDMSTRRHTDAMVPAMVIGDEAAREEFTRGMTEITDIAPAIRRAVGEN